MSRTAFRKNPLPDNEHFAYNVLGWRDKTAALWDMVRMLCSWGDDLSTSRKPWSYREWSKSRAFNYYLRLARQMYTRDEFLRAYQFYRKSGLDGIG